MTIVIPIAIMVIAFAALMPICLISMSRNQWGTAFLSSAAFTVILLMILLVARP